MKQGGQAPSIHGTSEAFHKHRQRPDRYSSDCGRSARLHVTAMPQKRKAASIKCDDDCRSLRAVLISRSRTTIHVCKMEHLLHMQHSMQLTASFEFRHRPTSLGQASICDNRNSPYSSRMRKLTVSIGKKSGGRYQTPRERGWVEPSSPASPPNRTLWPNWHSVSAIDFC